MIFIRIMLGAIIVVLLNVMIWWSMLEVMALETSIIVGAIMWVVLLFVRQYIYWSPVRAMRRQIEYMQYDIDELNERRIPGYRGEVRYLSGRIDELQDEIDRYTNDAG